jgi:hypothetical protein
MAGFLGVMGCLIIAVGLFSAFLSQNNFHTIIGVQTLCLGAIFIVGGAIVSVIRELIWKFQQAVDARQKEDSKADKS